MRRVLGLDADLLEPNRRQFVSNLSFHAFHALLWSLLTGIPMVGAWAFFMQTWFAWFVPAKEERAAMRFARSFVLTGFVAAWWWVFRKRVLDLPS